jgi:hypothetical protein
MRLFTTKRDLSPRRRSLVEYMQEKNFCTIYDLPIVDGEPVLSPMPRVVREFKFPGENGPRPELDLDDFPLKPQVVQLFACFEEIRDGTIAVIEVKHGLPFRMLVTEATA